MTVGFDCREIMWVRPLIVLDAGVTPFRCEHQQMKLEVCKNSRDRVDVGGGPHHLASKFQLFVITKSPLKSVYESYRRAHSASASVRASPLLTHLLIRYLLAGAD